MLKAGVIAMFMVVGIVVKRKAGGIIDSQCQRGCFATVGVSSIGVAKRKAGGIIDSHHQHCSDGMVVGADWCRRCWRSVGSKFVSWFVSWFGSWCRS